jgi:hypothetical protein
VQLGSLEDNAQNPQDPCGWCGNHVHFVRRYRRGAEWEGHGALLRILFQIGEGLSGSVRAAWIEPSNQNLHHPLSRANARKPNRSSIGCFAGCFNESGLTH